MRRIPTRQPTRGGRPVLIGERFCGRRGRLSFTFGDGGDMGGVRLSPVREVAWAWALVLLAFLAGLGAGIAVLPQPVRVALGLVGLAVILVLPWAAFGSGMRAYEWFSGRWPGRPRTAEAADYDDEQLAEPLVRRGGERPEEGSDTLKSERAAAREWVALLGRRRGRLYRVAWCVGGFLFPAAIMAIGLALGRQSPPTEAELAHALVHPDVLSRWVNGLALGHLAASALAVAVWHTRWRVWAATTAQVGYTLYWWFLATMAVQGEWL